MLAVFLLAAAILGAGPGFDYISRPSEPASEPYQQLWREAQTAMGKPGSKQTPLYKYEPRFKYKLLEMIGYDIDAWEAHSYAMVNEENLDKTPYGFKRHTLYHEAVHSAHNHTLKLYSLLAASLPAAIVAKTYMQKMVQRVTNKPIPRAGSILMLCATSYISTSLVTGVPFKLPGNYSARKETEADTVGAKSLHCARCTREAAVYHTDNNLGYLNYEQMRKIADEQSRNGECCDYHRKHYLL